MNTQVIKLMDCVEGTSTNAEGVKLFYSISKLIDQGAMIKLSLEHSTAMSSSFMNSSFGELVEKYGIEKFKQHVRLINFKPSEAEYIKNYLNQVVRYIK